MDIFIVHLGQTFYREVFECDYCLLNCVILKPQAVLESVKKRK